MIRVHCYTKQVELPDERWPTEMVARPIVGDIVYSLVNWGQPSRPKKLRMEVGLVSHQVDRLTGEPMMSVELVIPTKQNSNDTDKFYDFYDTFKGNNNVYS